MRRALRAAMIVVVITAGLRTGAEEAGDALAVRIAGEFQALRSEDPAEREAGLKRLVAEGPAALTAIRAQIAVEKDVEAKALLQSAPDLIDFEELRKVRWVAAGAPEPVPGGVSEFCLSPDGALVATTGWDRRVVVYRMSDFKQVRTFEVPEGENTSSVGFSEDSEWVAVYGSSPHVWSVRDGAEIDGWQPSRLNRGRLYERKDGEFLIAGSRKLLVVRKSLPELLPDGLARVDGGTAIATFYEAAPRGVWTGPAPDGFQGLGISVIDPRGPGESRQQEWKSKNGRRDAFPFAGLQLAGDRFGFTTEGQVHVCRMSDLAEEHCFGTDVACLARSGATWITGHQDGTLRTWVDGKEQSCVDLGAGRIWHVLATEKLIYAEKAKDSVLIVRASGFKIAQPQSGHTELDASGAYCLDGSHLRVWNNEGEGRVVVLPGISKRAWWFARNGGRLLVDNGSEIAVYDERNGRQLASLNGHGGTADSIEWCGKTLVCRVRNGPSYALDPTGDLSSPKRLSGSVFCAAGRFVDLGRFELSARQFPVFSSDGSTVAFETSEGECVMRESDGAILCEADHHGDAWLSPHGETLALVGWGEGEGWSRGITWSIWDTRSGKRLVEEQLPEDRGDCHVEFAADGRIGLFGNRLRIFDTAGAVVHHEFDNPGEPPFCTEGLAGASMSPDGTRLVLQARHGAFRLEDTADWKALVDEPAHEVMGERATKIRWSPDGRRIALHRGGQLWWIPAGSELASAPSVRLGGANQNEDRELFDFLPDGHLAVVTTDGLEIMHLATGGVATTVPGVKGTMMRVSPDGRWIAVLSSSRVLLFRREPR